MEQSPATPSETTAINALEGTTTENKTVETKKDDFAERMEMIARKERAALKKLQEAKDLESKYKEMESKYNSYEAKRASAKMNPLDFLQQETGQSYDDLTQFVLNGGKPTEKSEILSLKEEIQALKDQIINEKKQAEEYTTKQQTQAQQEAAENFRSDIKDFIQANKKDFAYAAVRESSIDEVYSYIADKYKSDVTKYNDDPIGPRPKPISIKEATTAVNNLYKSELKKFTELEEFRNEFGFKSETKEPSKTLTNSMSSSAPSMLPATTDNERIKRALAMLETSG